MTRDTSKDTDVVWFHPDRGYIFRDTEPAPKDDTEGFDYNYEHVIPHEKQVGWFITAKQKAVLDAVAAIPEEWLRTYLSFSLRDLAIAELANREEKKK